jgi:hypothetical protein
LKKGGITILFGQNREMAANPPNKTISFERIGRFCRVRIVEYEHNLKKCDIFYLYGLYMKKAGGQ